MGLTEILEKLNTELQKETLEECQVVYILSRIRKHLELKGLKQKYKYLNFYCNWALHSKIDRTEPVADILRDFAEHRDGDRFLKFDVFLSDLKKYLTENNLSFEKFFEHENLLRFLNLLVAIYADTPVEFYLEDRKEITLKKPDHPLTGETYSVAYEIK